jgi:hypothetical protein
LPHQGGRQIAFSTEPTELVSRISRLGVSAVQHVS